ncbi:hypothetical protein, conserved [Trypanosoma brucei gambiense DAL972]|uniref:J domain-containing protein n=2 Tax=Trypanosoma brucei TaxID=5691 RepID=D0A839_TRYB9|nr:hypothetical protein, conserved [Trypanosoma brucei gambiense DAL972]RHW68153.1 DnaJ domain containing protein [Trypanosoma brucei equiperdum]CBH17840.1 hypothetical protein, conserved [Trypanosoma brucei gambiense DAL972]|eukprot:XP_011780104.1 hypothetical protein, conserved [Trypanosoma brucei gambiense DAL972]
MAGINTVVSATPSLYAVLGVAPTVSQAELTRQFKRLSLQLHPDRAAYRTGEDEAEVQRQYQSIVEAYEVLSNPDHRRSYDTKCGVNFSARVAALRQTLAQNEVMPVVNCPTEPTSAETVQVTEDEDDEEYTP